MEPVVDVGLLACPLCGGTAFAAHETIKGHPVWCSTGDCISLAPKPSRDEAIATWNTRAPSPDLKADNAALVALQMVEDAMHRMDGKIVGFGWNITALNKARPFIHAALQAEEKV